MALYRLYKNDWCTKNNLLPLSVTSYIPDEDEPISSSSEEGDVEHGTVVPNAEEEGNDKKVEPRTRRKRRHIKQCEWKKNAEKLKKQSGQEYLGKRKKEGAWDYNIAKKSKSMGERCKCEEKSGMKCKEISNENRAKLFDHFWRLTWAEKQVYTTTLI